MARSSTTFKAGMPSPNPGGRRRGISDIRELARTYTNEAIATLASIMMDLDAKESARIAAATALLERGWGKPEQAINIRPPVI